MKERKVNECGSVLGTRSSSGSRPPRGNRPRDNSLFSSFHKRVKRKPAKLSEEPAFKWDDVEGDLAQALREAGL